MRQNMLAEMYIFLNYSLGSLVSFKRRSDLLQTFAALQRCTVLRSRLRKYQKEQKTAGISKSVMCKHHSTETGLQIIQL